MTTAKIVCDSVSAATGIRLTTLQLVYPRFIHAEFMTHRVFSRNASSSRAIPVSKMLEQVRNNPAMPSHWGKNQPGMQAEEELSVLEAAKAKTLWLEAANAAADIAEQMKDSNVHKQVANRILEPFQYIHVVVTATEWDNFFMLRDHPDAQPEIKELAIEIKGAMKNSIPNTKVLGPHVSNWHLPYIQDGEFRESEGELARKCSAARCARVSYLNHDGSSPSIAKDMTLYKQLIESEPMHASPVEHQATPTEDDLFYKNFKGWIPFRKVLEN